LKFYLTISTLPAKNKFTGTCSDATAKIVVQRTDRPRPDTRKYIYTTQARECPVTRVHARCIRTTESAAEETYNIFTSVLSTTTCEKRYSNHVITEWVKLSPCNILNAIYYNHTCIQGVSGGYEVGRSIFFCVESFSKSIQDAFIRPMLLSK